MTKGECESQPIRVVQAVMVAMQMQIVKNV